MTRTGTARNRANEDRMDFRLSSDHKSLIEKAAAYSGQTLTGFAVATLVEQARRVVRDHEAVAMTERDRDRFLELLDHPPAPSEALRGAARRHRGMVESE